MGNHVSIRDLELVKAVDETGSFSAAALRLHVSQSAVSQRLRALTERLGVDLFERKLGVMKPTDAGKRISQLADAVCKEITAAFDDLDSIQHREKSRLRLATECYTCYRWLPFAIRDLQLEYPDLHIDVIWEATEDPIAALVGGQIDVAITSDLKSPANLGEWPLFDDEMFAILRSDDRLGKRTFVNARDFTDRQLIVYTGGESTVLQRILIPAGVGLGRIIKLQMTEAIVELVRSGIGITFLAGWAFNDLEDKSDLVAIRITRQGIRRSWRAVTSSANPRGHISRFIERLRQIGGHLDDENWRHQVGLLPSASVDSA